MLTSFSDNPPGLKVGFKEFLSSILGHQKREGHSDAHRVDNHGMSRHPGPPAEKILGPPKTCHLGHRTSGGMAGCLGVIDL